MPTMQSGPTPQPDELVSDRLARSIELAVGQRAAAEDDGDRIRRAIDLRLERLVDAERWQDRGGGLVESLQRDEVLIG